MRRHVSKAFKIYYPIRRHEVGPITSNVLFREMRRTRLGNVIFFFFCLKKRSYVAGNKRIVTAEKRRFQFRFTCKSLYTVVCLRTEVLSTPYINAHDENAENRYRFTARVNSPFRNFRSFRNGTEREVTRNPWADMMLVTISIQGNFSLILLFYICLKIYFF